MKGAALELRNVTKRFGGMTAVESLSFSVRPGQTYCLIGPNGSGKTTTIKMIAGLYRPTSGAISVGGVDLAKSPTKAKRMLGYVPDDPSAYDLLTGREFLEFAGELHDMPRVERDARIAALLAEYGLERLAEGYYERFSRGTKQKLSFLAALLHRPSVLLVDEPMVGLDPESATVTKRLINDLVQGGGAVLLCTHTLPVAEEIGDVFGVLRGGKLILEGTLAEMLAKAPGVRTLEEAYLSITKAV